ncbi:hypothetical protein [Thalassotalea marina]|uniref:Prepilin-type N-terminal cleavage/methylation domain-containing protein n=1 Tax=Thalassotalea marina TaxID=1673741 RepID=A0A919BBL1_9GAMM|nr:hypothetical protein [Thalassotalea marina]GHF80847.1 hypothetical protein GCM10017161_05200 [Thalassotalea marina]
MAKKHINSAYDCLLYSSSLNREKLGGFTLIEVLVATVILISSLAIVSLVYRGAYLSSEKAEHHAMIALATPSVLANMRYSIRNKGNNEATTLTDKGEVWGVSYHWEATLSVFEAPQARLNITTGKLAEEVPKYKLWHVVLSIQFADTVKHFSVKEISWNDK